MVFYILTSIFLIIPNNADNILSILNGIGMPAIVSYLIWQYANIKSNIDKIKVLEEQNAEIKNEVKAVKDELKGHKDDTKDSLHQIDKTLSEIKILFDNYINNQRTK